jgi:1-acyl-sn-glycerol-3-phosphate acyltransferase
MISLVRASWRIAAYCVVTPLCMLVQAMALTLHLPFQRSFPMWYHRQTCRIMGLRVEQRGEQSAARPTLFVSNHVSYADIEVLGSLIKASFVAKAEVREWPIFGWLARLQRSVFVERRPGRAAESRDEMGERLRAGDSLILFPEGTTSDGNRILPFKSALFSVAEQRIDGQPVTVQPVSVAYAKLDGMPMGRYLRPYVAWYGAMELGGHFARLFGLGTVTVIVEFHPPVTIDRFGGRKALSAYCQAQVGRGVVAALTGRPQPEPQLPALPVAVPAAVPVPRPSQA